VEGGHRGLELVRAWPPQPNRGIQDTLPFGNPVGVPEPPVLVLEQDEVAVCIEPGRATGIVEQHQREQAERFRLVRHESGKGLRQTDRLVEQLVAGRRSVAGVEDEVEDDQHGAQAIGQQMLGRDPERNAGGADLPLRTDEPLRHRRLGHEEGSRDLLGRQPTDGSKGEGHLRLGGEGRMAAGEDETETIVRDRAHLFLLVRGHVEDLELPLERLLPPDPVDGSVARRRQEPRRWVVRRPDTRPALERRFERLLERVLGEVEVAEDTNQGGEDPATFLAEQPIDVGGLAQLAGAASRS
jgi:hypothetical protein